MEEQPQTASKSVSTEQAIYEASAGESETNPGELPGTLEPEAQDNAQSNSNGSGKSGETLDRSQALAVAWTGIEALAKMPRNSQKKKRSTERCAILFNDLENKILWIGLPGVKVTPSGRLEDVEGE